MSQKVLLLITLVFFAISFANGAQRLQIRGRLICGSDSSAAQNVRVRTVDKDIGKFLNLKLILLHFFHSAKLFSKIRLFPTGKYFPIRPNIWLSHNYLIIIFCLKKFKTIVAKFNCCKINSSQNLRRKRKKFSRFFHEFKHFLGFDDDIAEVRTDQNGNFSLDGMARDLIGNINPELKIYHRCNAKFYFCERRLVMKIPSRYLNGPVLDIGVLNLDVEPKEEDTKCFGWKAKNETKNLFNVDLKKKKNFFTYKISLL